MSNPPALLNSPRSASPRISSLLTARHGGLVIFLLVFVGLSFLTRVALLAKAAPDVTWNLSLIAAFGWGLLYDLGAAAFAALPLIVLLTFLPAGFFQRRWAQWSAAVFGFLTIFLLLFGAVSEWTFWDEFGVRFNFIAVDYLVYTKEVIGNIRESYNMPLIVASVAAGAVGFTWVVARTGLPAGWFAAAPEKLSLRLKRGALWFAVALACGVMINSGWQSGFKNTFNREIGKNGLWSLFAAFKNNQLEYDQFFPTIDDDEAFRIVRRELARDGSTFLTENGRDTLRFVHNEGPALTPNVIQITVESLSADFLGIFNRASRLTPELEALAAKSLVFDNFYATGTRTDRGMEALTLAVPPTPGRSIVKRPRNERMFTLGSVLRARGYDTAFIYGGFGYFDNMNHFFGENGYRVIDRTIVDDADITFANVWGACDEDLFTWTMREADKSAAAGVPFHHFVMTTSNHRPFTYPAGRIDLPSKVSGRAGAVKYTDYAIGKFLREAASKPWFKNTVFVIVADHCAGSAGKTELPVQNYHIPLIIYSPGGHIAPGRIKTFTSQIDYPPTLLGLLNWSYPSRFFGRDVRKIDPQQARVLVGNYQKLGFLRAADFLVLKPIKQRTQYLYDRATFAMNETAVDTALLNETISYYQAGSYLYQHRLYNALTPEEYARFMALGAAAAKP